MINASHHQLTNKDMTWRMTAHANSEVKSTRNATVILRTFSLTLTQMGSNASNVHIAQEERKVVKALNALMGLMMVEKMSAANNAMNPVNLVLGLQEMIA